jgi:xanthine dehydrogenase molybdopterin-binding subunit B
MGAAKYSDDVPEQQGCLYAAYVTAHFAKGTVTVVDASAASETVPGFVRFVGPDDVPVRLWITQEWPVIARAGQSHV